MSKRLVAQDTSTLEQDVPPAQLEKVFLIGADLIAYQRWHADGEAVGWDEPRGTLPVFGDLVVDVCRAGGTRFVAGWSTEALYARHAWTYEQWHQSPPILLADVLAEAGLSARLQLPITLQGDRARQFTGALARLYMRPPVLVGPDGEQIDHRVRERSSMLRAAKLLNHGTICSACGTDYGKRAGGLGIHALDVHHLEPLGVRGAGITGLEDLSVVCASCHRMLHEGAGASLLSPEELARRL